MGRLTHTWGLVMMFTRMIHRPPQKNFIPWQSGISGMPILSKAIKFFISGGLKF